MARRVGIERAYLDRVGRACMNPDCGAMQAIEAHHIVALKYGGADKLWNLVALCRRCHQKGKRHRFDPDGTQAIELYTWKCAAELQRIGEVLDDERERFAIIDHYKAVHADGSNCEEVGCASVEAGP